MIASTLIIGISVVLFLYWFRYTCVLILNTRTSKDYTQEVAQANQLQFPAVEGALGQYVPPNFNTLHEALERDYRIVNYLLDHTAHLEVQGVSIEQYVLRADYAVMRLWFRAASRISHSATRNSLREMSQIVSHLANSFGERLAHESQAS